METSSAQLFPNPADQSINVEAEDMTHVTVYNMLGQLTYEADVDGNRMKINVSEWNEGIYLMKIQTGMGQVMRRVSIAH
jgi:hypothetical protein